MDDRGAALLDGLRRPLVGSLALLVGDRLVAEDLAQEALARAVLRWASVSRMERPVAWVYRVAFNLARSRFRRAAAERRAYSRVPRVSGEQRGPEASVPAAVAVRTAVAALPLRQRQVVVARFFADLSVADTAMAMGCAEGTVKSLTHKALAALRDAGLEEVGVDG